MAKMKPGKKDAQKERMGYRNGGKVNKPKGK